MTPKPRTGAEALDRLAGRDLNNDGRIVNLVICGNSKFYDYAWLESAIEEWVQYNDYPDLIILGGASGVDYLAERWADNNNVPLAVFTEAWSVPRPNAAIDSGRPQAAASLVERMLERATHMLAFPDQTQYGPNEWKMLLRIVAFPWSAGLCLDERLVHHALIENVGENQYTSRR